LVSSLYFLKLYWNVGRVLPEYIELHSRI
jgi:hypothetical protein